ncbi:uncharacterized protein LOC143572952 [Bidens hawaiensis]|uniref:uncharacterized protein LOC143572952 n=1 Tax=Bidens hawaiensis TaxID=980011 RepID=UPI00404A813F
MWEDLASKITQVAKETLEVTTGKASGHKKSWWWNKIVQDKIRDKQWSFRELMRCTNEKERVKLRETYNKAKREANKKQSSGENDMFKIAKARERRMQDLGVVKFIKGEDGRILAKEQDIKLRWQTYFHNLFNSGSVHQKQNENTTIQQRNNCYYRRITQEKVRNALRKMGRAKAVGLESIPIEVWKCLGEEGVMWLTTLFNTILKTEKMPDQWRSSVVVPIYKNKGDTQCCGNYRGIKLLSHTMKLWERVIDVRLRPETQVEMNQFGFVPGRSTRATATLYFLKNIQNLSITLSARYAQYIFHYQQVTLKIIFLSTHNYIFF